MNWLAIIPTRAKSSGLPGKSVRPLNGKPLVEWTIEQAKRVGIFKSIVVVSDGETDLSLAQKQGVIGVRKPEPISGGDVLIDVVIEFVLRALEKHNLKDYDGIFLLNPTSPLRSDEDILACMRLLRDQVSVPTVLTVVKDYPIIMKRLRNARRGLWHVSVKSQNRQQRPPSYIQNGAVYATRMDYFKEAKKLIGPRVLVHVMPEERSVDIDTIWDFITAERFMQEKQKLDGELPDFIPAKPTEAVASPVA